MTMTTTIDVGSESELNSAISTVDSASSPNDYLIQFTSNITETSALTAIKSVSGVTATIDGGSFTLDGASTYQGFFVYSGDLTIQNLTIADALAQGGIGQQGSSLAGGGGGGAGLGGGLFIAGTNGTLATGGTVTLSAVNFVSDVAHGGNGSHGSGGPGGALSGSTGGLGAGGVGSANGGFGGGGATGHNASGTNGGFGGGAGGSSFGGSAGSPGFGGGQGQAVGSPYAAGGGGLGAGADVFVQQGANLVLESGNVGQGTVTGGTADTYGGTAGSAFGNGIFLQGNQTITLAPATGQTLTIGGVIADQSGSGGTNSNAGAGGLHATGSGTIALNAVNTMTGSITLDDSTTLKLGPSGSTSAAALNFAGPATLELDSLNSKVKSVSGFTGISDALHFAGSSPGNVTLTQTAANSATIDGVVVTGTFGILTPFSDGNGGTIITACFAAGTLISTEAGESEIESLNVGDLVRTLEGPRPVVWTGHSAVDVALASDPEAAWLLRIRRDAFAPDMPRRDLLLTQEHCLYVDGRLIPARMLVNGRSIVVDRTIGAYTYYHVELERHGVLFAEGLPAESYLDTGNRAAFAMSDVVALHPGLLVDTNHQRWQTDAAAPLCIERAVVEPLWHMLNSRADALGLDAAPASRATTDDPCLRLVTDAGREVAPLRVRGQRRFFAVPRHAKSLRLKSRVAQPSQIIGPFVDDRRRFGVLVGEIAVWRPGRTVSAAHLNAPKLGGWFDELGGPCRWTTGDASLPLDDVADIMMLEIEVLRAGPYFIDPPHEPDRMSELAHVA